MLLNGRVWVGPVGEDRVYMEMQVGPGREIWVKVLDRGCKIVCVVSEWRKWMLRPRYSYHYGS